MKLKLVVVDLELTRRQRGAMGAGLSLALLLVGAVALGDVPVTFVAGETLKAADLNENFGSLDGRSTALEQSRVVATPWVGYDVTVESAGGPIVDVVAANGDTQTGHWRRVGDSIEVNISTQITACTGAGTVLWSLPMGLAVDPQKMGAYTVVGTGMVHNSGTEQLSRAAVLSRASTQLGSVSLDNAAVNGVDVSCADLGSSGFARFQFTVPVEGWNVDD